MFVRIDGIEILTLFLLLLLLLFKQCVSNKKYIYMCVCICMYLCLTFLMIHSILLRLCAIDRQKDSHHCLKSGNIPKTEGGQIHLYFMTVL